jgi:peptide/nickel transport system ATP-binding protein
MAKKKDVNYISAKEARAISRRNRKITGQIEKKRNRKHIPESEYVTKMRDENNIVEFDDVHTYFFSDIGTVKSVNGVSFDIPKGKTVGRCRRVRLRKIRNQPFSSAARAKTSGADSKR